MYKYLYCSVAYISVACPTYKKLVAGKFMFSGGRNDVGVDVGE